MAGYSHVTRSEDMRLSSFKMILVASLGQLFVYVATTTFDKTNRAAMMTSLHERRKSKRNVHQRFENGLIGVVDRSRPTGNLRDRNQTQETFHCIPSIEEDLRSFLLNTLKRSEGEQSGGDHPSSEDNNDGLPHVHFITAPENRKTRSIEHFIRECAAGPQEEGTQSENTTAVTDVDEPATPNKSIRGHSSRDIVTARKLSRGSPRIFATEAASGDEELAEVFRRADPETVFVYIGHEETEHQSTIRQTIKTNLCELETEQAYTIASVPFEEREQVFGLEITPDACTLDEQPLLDHIVQELPSGRKYFEPMCDVLEQTDGTGPTVVFVHDSVVDVLQVTLSSLYCPAAKTAHPDTETERQVKVRLGSSGEVMHLDDWMDTQQSKMELWMHGKSGSCNQKRILLENVTQACPSKAIQLIQNLKSQRDGAAS